MSDWTLIDLPPGEGSFGIAGYAVFDALGLRLGYVLGWIKDPDDRVRMLKVAVREWIGTKQYLVPIGSITLIDDERSQVHLRELTKRSIRKYCIEFGGRLPEPRLLKCLIRYFPNPRPKVVERVDKPDQVPIISSIRLNVCQDQGGEARSWSQHLFATGPIWIRLGHLGPPDWTRLGNISFDV